MMLGAGMAALGGLLTLGSQANAGENGGAYTVFVGLIGVGAITFCRGLVCADEQVWRLKQV
jgi:hypothetical protein